MHLTTNRVTAHAGRKTGYLSATVFATLLLGTFNATQLLAFQDPSKDQTEQSQQNGMTTGAARAPVKDSQMRPISAGGFADGAPVVFVDASKAAGLDKFHHKMGGPAKGTIFLHAHPELHKISAIRRTAGRSVCCWNLVSSR
jgi:hypothetical protein